MTTNILQKRLYWITLLFITLSGFAQMPIFKRYYIADIPGFGWLAKFYITHIIHYAAAIVMIALAFYLIADFLFNKKKFAHFTRTGVIKMVILFGLIVSGAMMVFKNLPGVYWGHGLISFLDIFHLISCMMLLAISFFTVIKKKKWVE